MSWIEKLAETYDRCYGAPQFAAEPLLPPYHILQQAHIEVIIDGEGNFLRASVLQKEETRVPATEGSAGRTGKVPPPHPLCDKVRYCASDYPKFGGAPGFYAEYAAQLARWCSSAHGHPKAAAVLAYARKGTLVKDLVAAGVLFCDGAARLPRIWRGEGPAPAILAVLPRKSDGTKDQGDGFIRWRVNIPGDPVSAVWEDADLQDRWAAYCRSLGGPRGLDCVTGQTGVRLARNHPKGIRRPGDGAKLISSNDTKGFTFRGRFESAGQACGIGSDTSQKAHSALGWLIRRQGPVERRGGQAVVAWAAGGGEVPDPLRNTLELLGAENAMPETGPTGGYMGDAGQYLARQLNKLINGYRGRLGPTDGVVVMALDSASPGRMAVTYYRELTGSEYLNRVKAWHEACAWPQRYSSDACFVGAPAPREIAEAAYGSRQGDKLRDATVERLLPCIVDRLPVPRDLVDSATRRACNRPGLDRWQWEKTLGIACGLFKGYHGREAYQMFLEEERKSRDYLFGRLLAVADHIEERALHVAREKGRETGAARLLQRFAERPFSTWRTIELGLSPYRARLRSRRPGVATDMEKRLDGIMCMFQEGDFDDRKLSGEFLLGYHCQRAALWRDATGGAGPEGEPGEEQEE